MSSENYPINYFPEITVEQKTQFLSLYGLYDYWNQKINLISRRDIKNLYERHILHSLGIAQIIRFQDDSFLLDVGTGGGFPGVPLAILFPRVSFLLIDSIEKKIKAVRSITLQLNLNNVESKCIRVEKEKGQFDFVISRASLSLSELVRITKKNITNIQQNALPNGFLCLKGGNLRAELIPFEKRAIEYDLSDFFQEEFFKTKKVIYLPA